MELQVQFTKRSDGNVIIRCTRQDGSVTWQRYDKQAGFFSFHDLSHLAVETVLELRDGFYGLIADGWDITEMDGKGPRGKLPYYATFAEHMVGLVLAERAGVAEQRTAAELNSQIEEMTGQPIKNPLTDLQLESVRERIASLFRDWAAIPAGGKLDLAFDRNSFAGNLTASKEHDESTRRSKSR